MTSAAARQQAWRSEISEDQVPPDWRDAAFIHHPDGDTSWHAQVEILTLEYRIGVAHKLKRKADAVVHARMLDGAPRSVAEYDAKWWRSRAEGQRDKFERIEGCGRDKEVIVQCAACGCRHEHPVTCACDTLCRTCRGKRAARERRRFLDATKLRLSEIRVQKLQYRATVDPARGQRGPWKPKMLTLTVPHVGTLEQRIDRAWKAFPIFMRRLRKYIDAPRGAIKHELAVVKRQLRSNLGGVRRQVRVELRAMNDPNMNRARLGREADSRVELYRAELEARLVQLHADLRAADSSRDLLFRRAFEWTMTNDPDGHPHWHTYLLSPYIPQSDLAELWRAAVLAVDVIEAQVPRSEKCPSGVVVDIRRQTGGKKGAAELIKYMTKDLLPDGSRVPPEVMARVYSSLGGRRRTQSSRGFYVGVATRAECRDCGEVASLEVVGVQPMPAGREERVPEQQTG